MNHEQMEDMVRDGEVSRQTEAEEKGFEPIEGFVTIMLDGSEITRRFRFNHDTPKEEIQESIGATAKDMADTLTAK